MTDIGVQAIGLAGVLLGALTTILATGINDRARWRRGQQVRWDERRLSAYVDFAQAVKDVYHLAGRLAADRVPSVRLPSIDHDTGILQLAEAEGRRSKAWEALLLLGDADTVRAAREWREAVWQVSRIAVVPEPGASAAGAAERVAGAAEWVAAIPAIDRGRDGFYEAARRSLGVSGGSVAQADWLSSNAPWVSEAK